MMTMDERGKHLQKTTGNLSWSDAPAAVILLIPFALLGHR